MGTPAPDSKMIELPGGDFSLFSNRIANRRSFPAQGSSSIFSCPSGIMLTPGTATQFRLPASIGKTMAWASKYDVINGKNLGLVQFTPEPGLAFQTLFTTNYALGLYGHQIVGDTLYTGFMDVKSTPYGMAYAAFITPIDINTWHGKIIQIHSPVFMAEACTQGNDGLAYGQFFNSSLTGFNYAKTDYKTLTQDIIGKSAHQMIAMGITSTNRLYGIALDGNLYEVNVDNGRRTLLDDGKGWHRGALSTDGAYIYDNYTEPDVPRNIDIIDVAKAQRLRYFTAENPWKGYNVPTYECGTLKAADGKTDLYWRMVKPVNFDSNKKYPTIIYVYGGPHAHNVDASWHYGSRSWETYMAQEGYLLFILDNRGSEHRGKEFEQATFRHLGQEEVKDHEISSEPELCRHDPHRCSRLEFWWIHDHQSDDHASRSVQGGCCRWSRHRLEVV